MPIELDVLRGIRTLAVVIGTSAILLFILTVIINIITMFPKRINPDKRKTRPWEPTAAVRIDDLPEEGQEIVNQGRPKRVKRYEANEEGFVLDYNRNRETAQKYKGKGKAFTDDGEIARRQLEPLSRLRPTPLALWSDNKKPPRHPSPGGPLGPPGPPDPGTGRGGGRGSAFRFPRGPAGSSGRGTGRGVVPAAPGAGTRRGTKPAAPGPVTGTGRVIKPTPARSGPDTGRGKDTMPTAPGPVTDTGRGENSAAPGRGRGTILPPPGWGRGITPAASGPVTGIGRGRGTIFAPSVTSGVASSTSTKPDSGKSSPAERPSSIDFSLLRIVGETQWAMALARQRQLDVDISAYEMLGSLQVLNLPIFYEKFFTQFMKNPDFKDYQSGDTGHPHWFLENLRREYYGDTVLPYVKPPQKEFDRVRIERTTEKGRDAIIERARKAMKYDEEFRQGVQPSASNTSSSAPPAVTISVPIAPLPNTTTSTSGIGIATTLATDNASIAAALHGSFGPAPTTAATKAPGKTAIGRYPIEDQQAVADYITSLKIGLVTGSSSQADFKTTTAPAAINPFVAAPRPPQTTNPRTSIPATPATPGGGLVGGMRNKIGELLHGLITPSSNTNAAAEVQKAFGPPNDLIVLPPTVKQNIPFHYVSDLHLEQTSYENFDFKPRASYLILAGDIGNTDTGSETKYRGFLARMCAKPELKRIFLVAGNRDFWPTQRNTVHGTLKMLRAFAEHPDTLGKLVFMENDRFVIEENGGKVVILGCTLWTERRRAGGSEPSDQNDLQRTVRHHASCDWIRRETKKIREDPKEVETRILIITHMPPSKSGTSPPEQTAKKLRDFNSGDSHGSDVIDGCKGHGYDHSSIRTTMPLLDWRDVWIWGHTHWNEPRYGKTRHGGMRFESNQRGNARGNPKVYNPKPPGAFKPEKIILV